MLIQRLTTPSAGATLNHPRWMAQCSLSCCTASSEHLYVLLAQRSSAPLRPDLLESCSPPFCTETIQLR